MKPTLVESMLPASERMATGEIPIGLTFVKYAYTAAKGGAPLDYVRLDKMLGDAHFAVLSNKAPRPSAGKAFIDYYLDDDNMKILAQSRRVCQSQRYLPAAPRRGQDSVRADGSAGGESVRGEEERVRQDILEVSWVVTFLLLHQPIFFNFDLYISLRRTYPAAARRIFSISSSVSSRTTLAGEPRMSLRSP